MYVCMFVTVNKAQCFPTEPQGAESCQHSSPQLPLPALMQSSRPLTPTPVALLSRISPHKPLNTSASTANGLQQPEGNICNYPRTFSERVYRPLTQEQEHIKKNKLLDLGGILPCLFDCGTHFQKIKFVHFLWS